jgi:hypothetical protein
MRHQESSESVGDASEDDEEDVEAGEGEQEPVENVPELWPGQNDQSKLKSVFKTISCFVIIRPESFII